MGYHKVGRIRTNIEVSDAASESKKAANPMGIRLFRLLLAERTGLEPATPGVTGRYSNQLNYHSW